MIRMKITFIVFQEGQPDEEVQTIVEFQDAVELAYEMLRLAAANFIVYGHPLVRAIAPPTKLMSRLRPRKGFQIGTAVMVKDVEELPVVVPPELLGDPDLLLHTAAARLLAKRKTDKIN